MNRAAWLEERRSGVGSSDAPNLVGVGFRDAASVYRSKVEPVADRPDPLLDLGTALEPIVAATYERVMGSPLLTRGMIDRHPARPWQLASLDRVREDGRPVEIKTVAGFGDQWGEPGSGDIPPGYRVQVLHQLGVVGEPFADVAALCRISGEFRVYRVEADAELFDWLTDVEARFWRDHVATLTPPGPEWEAQFDTKRFTVGKVVTLGSDVAGMLDLRKRIKGVLDDAQEEYDRLTARVIAVMGDAQKGECSGWSVKRITVPGGPVSYDRRPSTRLDARPVKAKGVGA